MSTFDATLIKPDLHIEEIWFAGGHSNVGGGFIDKAGNPQNGLSDITLRFMIERASRYGIKFKPEAFKITGNIRGPMQKSYGLQPRRIQVSGVNPPDPASSPRIHKSLIDRTKLCSDYKLPKNLATEHKIEDEQWSDLT